MQLAIAVIATMHVHSSKSAIDVANRFAFPVYGRMRVHINCRMTQDWLLGTWRLMRADPELDFAPGVRMEFCTEGQLRYHIDVGGSDQVVELVYRVDGDLLFTDSPASPHSMIVRIEHGSGDVLMLDFAGPRALLVREGRQPATGY